MYFNIGSYPPFGKNLFIWQIFFTKFGPPKNFISLSAAQKFRPRSRHETSEQAIDPFKATISVTRLGEFLKEVGN